MNITQQDAIWLVENYNKIRNFGKVSSWIADHVRAMSLIKGNQVSVPSCNCEYAAYARMANSMYEQNEAEIKAIAYPPQPVIESEHTEIKKSSRGRSKANPEA